MFLQIKDHEAKWLASCNLLAPIFSTCAKRQYFAVIISENKRLLSQGYNGSPPGMGHCNQGHCPRYANGSPSGSVYDDCIAAHAEANAIMWADPHARKGATGEGSTLIINGSPCYGCAKLIATSGIRRIIGQSDPSYAQEQHVVDYLKSNKIETILLTKPETRKILQQYKNLSLLSNETRIIHTHEHDHSPIPRHIYSPAQFPTKDPHRIYPR